VAGEREGEEEISFAMASLRNLLEAPPLLQHTIRIALCFMHFEPSKILMFNISKNQKERRWEIALLPSSGEYLY
jgi:hypothetical protein